MTEERKGGRNKGGGGGEGASFVSQERDGGGEREPDVRETRGERREEKMERNHGTI